MERRESESESERERERERERESKNRLRETERERERKTERDREKEGDRAGEITKHLDIQQPNVEEQQIRWGIPCKGPSMYATKQVLRPLSTCPLRDGLRLVQVLSCFETPIVLLEFERQ